MIDVSLGDEKLVSTTRAAKVSGYSQDYVGQLCRQGKIECRRVAGHWYIDESSLRDYQEGEVPPSPVRTGASFGMKVGNVRDDTFTYDGVEYISTSRAAELTGYAQDYIGQLARGGEVSARKVGRRWFVGRKTLVDHKRHNDGLLAAVQAEAGGLQKSDATHQGSSSSGQKDLVEIPINTHVDPGDIHFNVRYVPEEDKPLVPKMPFRKEVRGAYTSDDIYEKTEERTQAYGDEPFAQIRYKEGTIVQPRNGNHTRSVRTAHVKRQERPALASRSSSMQSEAQYYPRANYLARALFLSLILIFIFVSFALFIRFQAPSSVESASNADFISSLKDSYGHLVPGKSYYYSGE